ncbi:Flagellar hook-basal body complex protein FliE [Azospirillaceae bacterium]
MLTSLTNAVAAYSNASRMATPAVGMEPPPLDNKPEASFSSALESVTRSAIGTVKKSEQLSAMAAIGRADLTDVVNAVTNAEVTLQTVTAVRDKVITAYQEIMRMPI